MPEKQPAKNDIVKLLVEGYSSDGQGVARLDGLVVFIKGALDGELVRARLMKITKSSAWARVEDILEPSQARLDPDCPAYGRCGGCKLRHMSYGEELKMKLTRVNDAFERIAGLTLHAEEIIAADSTDGYRNKAQYAVARERGHAVTGFFRERSHNIVPVTRCAIQHPASDKITAAVRSWMERYKVSAYDEGDRSGCVRMVFARTGAVTGETLAVVSTATKKLTAEAELVRMIRAAAPGVVGVVHNINTTPGNTLLAGDFTTLWGRGYIEDELCSLRFRLSARSFYQINHAQAEKLYEKALEYAAVTPEETAVDLYCGTGTITLCLARGAGRVIGAEIAEAAVEDAKANAERNGIQNADFICADAADTAHWLELNGIRPDVVVVDPPRKGLSRDVIDSIFRMNPGRMVYISCDPGTLARDLKLLNGGGLTPVKAAAVDMFCRSPHVECVVLLERQAL